MTDEIQDLGAAQAADVSIEAPVADVSTDAELAPDASAEVPAAVEEKTHTQAQLNKILAREKRQYEQKYQAQYEARLAQERAALAAQNKSNDGSVHGMTKDELERVIDERADARAEIKAKRIEGYNIAAAYETKIRNAIAADPDFADDYDALEIENYPGLVILANKLDNTADVIRELARNPEKFSAVLTLSATSQKMAERSLQKLSASLKTNKASENQRKAPPPLGQIKSSNILTGDDKNSIASFRANPKYRG